MQKVFIGFTGLFFIGLVFMMMHWPGASLLKMLSCSSLACLVFIMAGEKGNNKIERIIHMLSAIIFASGLFKLMYWPGLLPEYKGMTIIGLLLLLVIGVLWFKPNEQLQSKTMFKRALLVLYAIFAVIFMIPRSEIYKYHRIASVVRPLQKHELFYEYLQLAGIYQSEEKKTEAMDALKIAKSNMPSDSIDFFIGNDGRQLETKVFRERVELLETRINALP
ncbi:MAG: hypothetical protein RLZZ262_990 [Bacteroidota bacterium]